MKTIRLIILLLVVAAVAGVVVWWKSSPEADRVTMRDAKAIDIRPMVRLCSVEIYEDYPVKASIGTRHFFARETLRGSISFDLDSIARESRGDTLVVTLPREIVEIHESTEPDSYEVIDTWNDRFLGSDKFTAAEENEIKRKAVANYRRRIYAKGYVKRARAEARQNLQSLLAATTGRPVLVTDPTPAGSPNDQ